MALVQPLAAARSDVRAHVQRAAAAVSQSIGSGARSVIPRARQTIQHASRSVGLAPHPGFHPGRYWPVLLIAVALAESAHAPLLNGALAAIKTPVPLPTEQPVKKTPASPAEAQDDMHGPHDPDSFLEQNKKENEPDNDPLQKLKLLVDPIPFHGVQNDVTLPDGGDLIQDTGGGSAPSSGSVLDPVFHGATGGGGSAGDGGFGGVAGPPVDITAGGEIGPVTRGTGDNATVPEPASASILLFGSLLLGRRGVREQQ